MTKSKKWERNHNNRTKHYYNSYRPPPLTSSPSSFRNKSRYDSYRPELSPSSFDQRKRTPTQPPPLPPLFTSHTINQALTAVLLYAKTNPGLWFTVSHALDACPLDHPTNSEFQDIVVKKLVAEHGFYGWKDFEAGRKWICEREELNCVWREFVESRKDGRDLEGGLLCRLIKTGMEVRLAVLHRMFKHIFLPIEEPTGRKQFARIINGAAASKDCELTVLDVDGEEIVKREHVPKDRSSDSGRRKSRWEAEPEASAPTFGTTQPSKGTERQDSRHHPYRRASLQLPQKATPHRDQTTEQLALSISASTFTTTMTMTTTQPPTSEPQPIFLEQLRKQARQQLDLEAHPASASWIPFEQTVIGRELYRMLTKVDHSGKA